LFETKDELIVSVDIVCPDCKFHIREYQFGPVKEVNTQKFLPIQILVVETSRTVSEPVFYVPMWSNNAGVAGSSTHGSELTSIDAYAGFTEMVIANKNARDAMVGKPPVYKAGDAWLAKFYGGDSLFIRNCQVCELENAYTVTPEYCGDRYMREGVKDTILHLECAGCGHHVREFQCGDVSYHSGYPMLPIQVHEIKETVETPLPLVHVRIFRGTTRL
jgi:hypothetical protein